MACFLGAHAHDHSDGDKDTLLPRVIRPSCVFLRPGKGLLLANSIIAMLRALWLLSALSLSPTEQGTWSAAQYVQTHVHM